MRLSALGACVVSAFMLAAPGIAGTPALLSGYNLTSWTQKDGLASALIWSVAQDTAGYLWLGTDAGALRFDGVRFVPWDTLASVPTPSASVRTVCVSRDGTVWFGLGEPGGIIALGHNTVRNFGARDGLPEGVVMALTEGADGTMWAGGRFGLYRLESDRWQDTSAGLPSGLVNAMLHDGETVVVGAASGVFRREAHERGFAPFGVFHENARSVSRDSRQTLWVADPIVGVREAGHGAPLTDQLKGRGSRVMHDSRGNLWVGTGGQGLWRVRTSSSGEPVALERTSTATGLSDDGVTELTEDRDGNIWVATRDGLNRLTPHRMTPITDLGIVNAVDATRDGRVWVGTVDAVVSFVDARIEARSRTIPLHNPPLAAMHADTEGTLWVATAKELMRVDGERSKAVPLNGVPITELTDIASDGTGGLWLHDVSRGLLRWRRGLLTQAALPGEFQSLALLASMTDGDGRAWFSFEHSRVAVLDSVGAVRVFGEKDGLTVGPYRAIHQDQAGAIWLGGDGGLSRWADDAFTTLVASTSMPVHHVTGIVDDLDGALWLAVEAAGLVRLSREEIAHALRDGTHQVRYTAYDKVDGSAGTSRWFGNRAAVRSRDGRLWFVAGRGVTVVDPKAVLLERPADDTVRIEGVVIDGQPQSASAVRWLPAGTARVQVDYTVPDLTSPQKWRFRYRLDGFDSDWIDAGARHAAFYTNLPPRAYTFRVMATSAVGAPTGVQSEWSFTLRPAFYQTWWFVAMSLASVVSGVGAAWRLHVRRMRREFSLLVGERARLSREVHDTLLQSMFGYALRFDALSAAASSSDPWLQTQLSDLRRQVEDDIREARQSIWNLRSPRLEQEGLPAALRGVADQATSAAMAVNFSVTGVPRRASAQVEEHLLRIGREAVSNAVRHAHAATIAMTLEYARDAIALAVSDDGYGFDPTTNAHSTGHFGLVTMRERAEAVGGTLEIRTGPREGTTLVATIPV